MRAFASTDRRLALEERREADGGRLRADSREARCAVRGILMYSPPPSPTMGLMDQSRTTQLREPALWGIFSACDARSSGRRPRNAPTPAGGGACHVGNHGGDNTVALRAHEVAAARAVEQVKAELRAVELQGRYAVRLTRDELATELGSTDVTLNRSREEPEEAASNHASETQGLRRCELVSSMKPATPTQRACRLWSWPPPCASCRLRRQRPPALDRQRPSGFGPRYGVRRRRWRPERQRWLMQRVAHTLAWR